jgi:recombination protein RecT
MSNEISPVQKANTLIKTMGPEFAKVLPKILTPDRFCRVVLSAVNKNPSLAQALSDPRNQASALGAFMKAAESGLEPDGRRATINCYKKSTGGYDITFIPMYQGLCELAMRSGQISNIHADKVCENDDFKWDTGKISHTINFKEPRGEAYAYYCVVTFKDGSTKTEVMSKSEVEAVRDRSSAFQASKKYGKSCPWITDFDEMAKKTVFRRCSKWLPLSPEQQKAFDFDNEDFSNDIASAVENAVNDKFAQAMAAQAPALPENCTIDAEIVEEPMPSENENLFDGEKK